MNNDMTTTMVILNAVGQSIRRDRNGVACMMNTYGLVPVGHRVVTAS